MRLVPEPAFVNRYTLKVLSAIHAFFEYSLLLRRPVPARGANRHPALGSTAAWLRFGTRPDSSCLYDRLPRTFRTDYPENFESNLPPTDLLPAVAPMHRLLSRN